MSAITETEAAELSKHNLISALPPIALRRLMMVGTGWVIVAAAEAAAYTILAFGVVNSWSPNWILWSTGAVIIITVLVNRLGYLTGVRLAGDLFAALGQSLSRTKLSWFTIEHRAQVAAIAGQGIPRFMSIPAHQLQNFLHAPCLPLFLVFGIGVLLGYKIAFIASALLIISLVAQFWSQRALMRSDAKRHNAEATISAATIELVDCVELLRAAAGAVRAIERIEQRWEDQENAFTSINRAAAAAVFVSTLASVLPIAGIAIYLMLIEMNDPVVILAVLMLVGRAAAPLGDLAVAGLGINDLLDSLKNYYRVTNTPALVESTDLKAVPTDCQVEVWQVSYSPVLKNINATIPEGSRVLLKGLSGSGKSTLLELLMRFDDPDRGYISIGGVKLNEIPYDNLVSYIAYVEQDPVIFTGTLAENIRIANPQASDTEIESVARQAVLGDVIDRSIEGIHQSVGQQGSALSGGERQRVALARAFMKHAPILVLDEATSALDEATELRIIKAIQSLSATVIFVTHRDPAIWQPTQIICLSC